MRRPAESDDTPIGKEGGLMNASALRIMAAVAALGGAACSLPTLLQKNLKAIETSTATISKNNETVQASTRVSEEGIRSFERLRGPMESMAGLEPTLKSVAALDAPLVKVGELGPSLHEVAGLQQPMTRLVDIRPSLEATAALGPSMDRLAAMRPSLDAVASLGDPLAGVAALRPQLVTMAELGRPMGELSALRQPLERVADLREPMTRLAALGHLLDRPLLLVALLLLGLGLWGLVTFFAVRLAILSASGALAARR
jgi:hypothetical protein